MYAFYRTLNIAKNCIQNQTYMTWCCHSYDNATFCCLSWWVFIRRRKKDLNKQNIKWISNSWLVWLSTKANQLLTTVYRVCFKMPKHVIKSHDHRNHHHHYHHRYHHYHHRHHHYLANHLAAMSRPTIRLSPMYSVHCSLIVLIEEILPSLKFKSSIVFGLPLRPFHPNLVCMPLCGIRSTDFL